MSWCSQGASEKIHQLSGKESDANENLRGEEGEITTKDSKVRVFVVPTNEELVIAVDTEKIVQKQLDARSS